MKNNYTDQTLLNMKKKNLIKYIRQLEEIIQEYDKKLLQAYKELEK